MTQGLQLIAPKGFRQLESKRRYHVLLGGEENQRLVLAHFFTEKPRFRLSYLETDRYQYAKSEGLIQVVGAGDLVRLPPLLQDREGEPFDSSPRVHSAELVGEPGRSLPEWHIVNTREEAIQDVVDDHVRIFSLPDPERELNRIARLKGQNESRFRFWVVLYLAFGRNRWVLLPPKGGRGKYDRAAMAEEGKKFGRPHRKGSEFGSSTTEASKALMVQGFKRCAKKGRSLSDVYIDVLVKFFKVTYVRNGDRTELATSRLDLPFHPSYGSFRYWVVKLLGHEVVWSTLLSEELYRNQFAAPVGTYSESLRDLLERVMSDAAAGAELPKSYLTDRPSLPLYQVECVDVLSSLGIGIAFGVGSERESLYSQCLASIALPKSMLGRVLNLAISDADYPVSGLMPLASQTDQGKGATNRLRELNKDFAISPERSPAYMPQSQAPVEAGHADRAVRVGGAPTHRVSSLTAFQMAQHRFLEFMSRGRSKAVLNRLTPELVAQGIQTPIELWKHFLSEGRITGTPALPVDVIVNYLPKVTFEVKGGRLTHDGVVYRPVRLIGTTDRELSPKEIVDVSKEIFAQKSSSFHGHRFEISNLVEWVVVGKRLIEVHCVPGSAEHLARTAMTAEEGAVHAELANANAATSRELRTAEGVRKRIDAMALTGKSFMQSTLKKGRARVRTVAAKAEAAALKAD